MTTKFKTGNLFESLLIFYKMIYLENFHQRINTQKIEFVLLINKKIIKGNKM
jgi:hypothetical protein